MTRIDCDASAAGDVDPAAAPDASRVAPAKTRRAVVRLLSTLLVGGIAVTALTGLTACGGGLPEPTPSADGVDTKHVVKAIDNAFEPREIKVKAGEAVRWEFRGSVEHDVVAQNESFVSPRQREGSYTHVFQKPGTYDYRCSLHPEMVGRVTVTK